MVEVDDFVSRTIPYVILLRCAGLLETATHLVEQKQSRACQAILKMVLEDVAVAYVHFEKKLKGLTNLNPTECISPLKRRIDLSGKLYGLLNLITHFDYRVLRDDISFKFEENRFILSVKKRDDFLTRLLNLMHVYLFIHHIYLPVFDLVMNDLGREYKYWSKDAAGLSPVLPTSVMNNIEFWAENYKTIE